MKDATRRTKSVLFLMSFMLLVAPAPVVAAPAPPQMAINETTKQCAEFFAGDECVRCTLTDGWKSIGYGAMCPTGYSMIDTIPVDAPVVVCEGLANQLCCSENSSGGPGDCEDMVINDDEKRCAFVNGGIESCGNGTSPPMKLPPGWTIQAENPDRPWQCPEGYIWVDAINCVDSCGGSLTCLECLQGDCCWFELSPSNKCISDPLIGGWGVCPSEEVNTTDQEICEEFETLQMDNEACKALTNCDDCLATTFPSNESKKCRWFIFGEEDAGNCWAFCKGSLNCAQAERYSCSKQPAESVAPSEISASPIPTPSPADDEESFAPSDSPALSFVPEDSIPPSDADEEESSAPSATTSSSLRPPQSTPPADLLLSITPADFEGCMEDEDNISIDKVFLRVCDSTKLEQKFKYDGAFRTGSNEDKCLQAGYDGDPAEGEFVRVADCDLNNSLQKFTWDFVNGFISLTDNPAFCMSFRGINANVGADPVLMKRCEMTDYEGTKYFKWEHTA